MLGSPSDDSLVDFQNPINLGSATQTIQVTRGLALLDARLSGVLSSTGTAGLTISGNGVLELTADNTYAGVTTVSGVVLRLGNTGALPGGTVTNGGMGNLILDGGVIELAASDFTRSSGYCGPAKCSSRPTVAVSAAVGANRNVNLGRGLGPVDLGR